MASAAASSAPAPGDLPDPPSSAADTVMGVLSVVLGAIGLCSCGLTSLPGIVLGTLTLIRGRQKALGLVGLLLSTLTLLFAVVLFATQPDDDAFAKQQYYDQSGLPPLPAGATNDRYSEKGHTTSPKVDLYAAFDCNEQDAIQYLNAIAPPDQRKTITRASTIPKNDIEPLWYNANSVSHGWSVSASAWGPNQNRHDWLLVVYDRHAGRMYIHAEWFSR